MAVCVFLWDVQVIQSCSRDDGRIPTGKGSCIYSRTDRSSWNTCPVAPRDTSRGTESSLAILGNNPVMFHLSASCRVSHVNSAVMNILKCCDSIFQQTSIGIHEVFRLQKCCGWKGKQGFGGFTSPSMLFF